MKMIRTGALAVVVATSLVAHAWAEPPATPTEPRVEQSHRSRTLKIIGFASLGVAALSVGANLYGRDMTVPYSTEPGIMVYQPNGQPYPHVFTDADCGTALGQEARSVAANAKYDRACNGSLIEKISAASVVTFGVAAIGFIIAGYATHDDEGRRVTIVPVASEHSAGAMVHVSW